jgi:hypothetical protein
LFVSLKHLTTGFTLGCNQWKRKNACQTNCEVNFCCFVCPCCYLPFYTRSGASEPYHRLADKEKKARLALLNNGDNNNRAKPSRRKKNDNEEANGEEKFETINEREVK